MHVEGQSLNKDEVRKPISTVDPPAQSHMQNVGNMEGLDPLQVEEKQGKEKETDTHVSENQGSQHNQNIPLLKMKDLDQKGSEVKFEASMI